MQSFSEDFLKKLAKDDDYDLSEDQEAAFVKRFSNVNKNEQEVADTLLYISSSAFRTRMTEVYRKFSIGGKGQGSFANCMISCLASLRNLTLLGFLMHKRMI